MKWTRKRFLLLPYVVLLAALVVVGCTSKQDPSETLPVCGNHSCGDLVMVTTDTSSDGYHYLNPSLSPDGTRILFTADWWAIPSDPRYEGDDLFTSYRQMIILPVQEGVEPTTNLTEQGGELVLLFPRSVQYSGADRYLSNAFDADKADPIWQDDDRIIFTMRHEQLADTYRLFRADLTDLTGGYVRFEPIFMEGQDYPAFPAPPFSQHLEPAISPDGRWLVFTRSSCAQVDSFETCSGVALWALDMSTAGDSLGYGTTHFPVTGEYSRIEDPSWSPDGSRIVFSGGMDLAGQGVGAGTELYTVEFDTSGLATDTMPLDRNIRRLTYTERSAGDPIAGILNSSPKYSNDGGTIFFVSTRRAPSITLHDRNIWRIPSDGSLDPVIHYFTRSDDVDPTVLPDGRIMLSSALGFPTEMLNRLEEEAYQCLAATDTTGLTEVQLREAASDERRQLEFFEGVMTHIYIYRP